MGAARYEFIQERVEERIIRSPKTRKWYEDSLAQFAAWCQEVEKIGHVELVTKATVRRFLYELHARGCSDAYADGHFRTQKAFWRWARRVYQVDASLFDQVDGTFTVARPEVKPKEKQRFTDEQVVAIFDAVQARSAPALVQRNRVLLMTYLGSGCRLTEIANLKVGDIQQDADGASFLHVLGKGEKWRWVPISTRLRRELERYLNRHRPASSTDYVFVTHDGKRLSSRIIQHFILKVSREVGFRLHAHAFRHHYATHYMAQPHANPKKLQHILGHSSISTTMDMYVHPSREDLASDIEDFAPL